MPLLDLADFVYAAAATTQRSQKGIEHKIYSILLVFMVLVGPIYSALSLLADLSPILRTLEGVEGPRNSPALYYLAMLLDGIVVLFVIVRRAPQMEQRFSALGLHSDYWSGVAFASIYLLTGVGFIYLQKASSALCIGVFLIVYILGSVLLGNSKYSARRSGS